MQPTLIHRPACETRKGWGRKPREWAARIMRLGTPLPKTVSDSWLRRLAGTLDRPRTWPRIAGARVVASSALTVSKSSNPVPGGRRLATATLLYRSVGGYRSRVATLRCRRVARCHCSRRCSWRREAKRPWQLAAEHRRGRCGRRGSRKAW